jgi:hypothetical protein
MNPAEIMIKSDLPTLHTSSDSRKAVCFTAWAWSFIWLLAFFNFVLAPSDRQALGEILVRVKGGGISVSIFASGLIAILGFYLLDLHETVYDRIFVKWRARHEADFILPRLFGPMRDRFISDYADIFKSHARTLVIRVFCPFISGNEHKLDPVYMRNFYKALTLYWITELTEIAIITWIASTFAYALMGRLTGSVPVEWQAILLFQVCGAITLGALNNLVLVRAARQSVRNRTQEEIDDIMLHYRPELEEYVLTAAKTFNILRTEVPAIHPAATLHRAEVVVQDENRAFLASPMASLAPAEYRDDRDLMLQLCKALKQHCGFTSVFYAGERIKEQANFDDELLALDKDLREIRHSGVFIFHYPERVASSALFELGFALALRKRIVLLIRNRNHLPFLVRAACQLDRVTECTYKDADDLLRVVEQSGETLFGYPESTLRIA